MKRKILVIVMAFVMVLSGLSLMGCEPTEPKVPTVKENAFTEETVFQLDLSMGTAIGPLADLCHPGTITFRKDGTAKMFVKFTPNAKMLMETLLSFIIPDFVHEDTYELSANKNKITYTPIRDSFKGEKVEMEIEKLSDDSMKIVFDISAVIPDTTLTFYSNPDQMPPQAPVVTPPAETSYEVSFDAGEGAIMNENFTLPEDATYSDVTEITLPEANFTLEGNKFRGWAAYGKPYTEGEKYLYNPGEKYSVDSSVSFMAVWSNSFKVTIEPGEDAKISTSSTFFNAIIAYPEIQANKYVYLPENPYTYKDNSKGFAYWNGGGKDLYPGASFKVTEDVVFTPVWKEFVNVTFMADTGDGKPANVAIIRTPKDSKIELPDSGIVSSSDNTKGFVGWVEEGKTSATKPGTMVTIKDNVVYTAKMDSLVTISFEADGATGDLPDTFKIGKGMNFYVPECNLTKEGFAFNGWNVKGKTTVSQPYAKTSQTVNTTYVADWKTLRTISFNLGTGVTGEVASIIQGEKMKITLPEMTATNGDKLFGGWNDGKKTYKPNAQYTVPVGTDTVMNAVWYNMITVSFVGGEGATGTMENIKQNETLSFVFPENKFTKPGKGFGGWSDGTVTYAVGDTYTIAVGSEETLQFTAVWGDVNPYSTEYTATFRAKQTGVKLYVDTKKDEEVGLNAIMQMSELVLRPDSTADLDIRFLASDANLKKHTDLMGITVAELRAMEVTEKNVFYSYDAQTNKVTLKLADNKTYEITLKKVAKNADRPYDSVEFTYNLSKKVGEVQSLVFAAIDGKPTYAEKTRYFKATEKISISIISGFPTLTVNPDGTGELKVGSLGMDFNHAFNPDFTAVIWLGGEGDRIEAPVKVEDGKTKITVSLLGHSIVLEEVASL